MRGTFAVTVFTSDLALARPLDGALPRVDRRHLRAEAHAGRQALGDERLGEGPGVGVRRKRREHDDHAGGRGRRHDGIGVCGHRFPMYKRGDLGYNSWSMAATPTSLPGPTGKPRARRGRGGFRALVIVFSVCVGFVVIDAFVGDRGLAALVRARQEHDRLAAEVESRKAGERQAARAGSGGSAARIPRPSKKSPGANSG